MNYIFVVNDILFGDFSIKTEEIIESLLNRKCWVYTANCANLSKISKGDKVLVYAAGNRRGHVLASFEIADQLKEMRLSGNTNSEEKIFKLYRFMTPITNVEIWEPPVVLRDIKDHLHFIKDKKNWGLFFRQSTKLIEDTDYAFIVNQRK